MKALSVSQPWASLILSGAKRFETRSWQTSHRGPLVIHAARTFPPALRLLCHHEPFRGLLRQAGIDGWAQAPLGAMLGTVELESCTRVEELGPITALDEALGDYAPGRWAWKLSDPRPWPEAVPAVGRLGVFEVKHSK